MLEDGVYQTGHTYKVIVDGQGNGKRLVIRKRIWDSIEGKVKRYNERRSERKEDKT